MSFKIISSTYNAIKVRTERFLHLNDRPAVVVVAEKNLTEKQCIFPREILGHILSFYDSKTAIPAVCKDWHASLIPAVYLYQLSEKESLTTSEIVVYQRKLKTDLDGVFVHCKKLKKLDFSRILMCSEPKIQENELLEILHSAQIHCPTIRILDFANNFVLGNKTMTYLGSNYSHLTHLSLKNCEFSRAGIKQVIENCINLISLDLSKTAIGDTEVLCIAKHCSKLQRLDLSDSCSIMETGPVTDESILVLSEKCPGLTHLCIPYATITVLSLMSLGENNKNLRYFFHFGCPYIDKNDTNKLKQKIPSLVTSDQFDDYKNHRFEQ